MSRQRNCRRRDRLIYRSRGRWCGSTYSHSILLAAPLKYKPGSGTRHERCSDYQQYYFPDYGSGRRPAPLLEQITRNTDSSVRPGFFALFMLDFSQGIKDITHTFRSLSGKKPMQNAVPEPFTLIFRLKFSDNLRCNRGRNREDFTGPGHNQRLLAGHIDQPGNTM